MISQSLIPQNNVIMCASWNGTAWNIQEAVSRVTTGGVGTHVGFFTMGYLSLDSHDTPHIAFANDFASVPSGWGNLGYASLTGKTWDIQIVDSTILAQSCYLSLGSDDNPYISLMGVIQGSEAADLTGPYTWISPVMYATAILPSVMEPTETAIVIVFVVAMAACVGLLVYFKKRKKQKYS